MPTFAPVDNPELLSSEDAADDANAEPDDDADAKPELPDEAAAVADPDELLEDVEKSDRSFC
jgi:hypothetical protein